MSGNPVALADSRIAAAGIFDRIIKGSTPIDEIERMVERARAHLLGRGGTP
jgi:hypothetical protein